MMSKRRSRSTINDNKQRADNRYNRHKGSRQENFTFELSESTRRLIDSGRAELLTGIGLPEDTVFEADEFQKQAIESVNNNQDTLVVAPTGSGKTFIAFEALKESVKQGKRGVYTTPLKALSNTKYNELRAKFKDICEVGLLTGDRKIDSNSQIVVATTEIYRNELYREPQGDALVILDEVHFIADPQRGPVWEESIILTPRSSTLLMLSASISNSDEIRDWVSDIRGNPCNVVTKIDRPVELRFGFMHPDYGILPLRSPNKEVFPEVQRYYSGVGLDASGMRLKGGRFSKRTDKGFNKHSPSNGNTNRTGVRPKKA